MVNFKESLSKIKNGAMYYSLLNEEMTEEEQKQPQQSPFLKNFNPYYQDVSMFPKKTEKIVSYFKDEENCFNFLSRSSFKINLKGLVNISSIKVNQFNFFQDGEDYLDESIVILIRKKIWKRVSDSIWKNLIISMDLDSLKKPIQDLCI